MVEIIPEVADALGRGRPVVALESTLIAHGLPWPDNLETARRSEAVVREAGAIPATVAILGGAIRVGLEAAELEGLAAAPGRAIKAGRRDLSAALASGSDAATTVSATLWIARKAGIGAMATGGIGGVHRGAAASFDVSSDLDELAAADGMLLACSGVKSILDVAATLEALETRGVAVVGYRTAEFPAFVDGTSGLAIGRHVDDAAGLAAIVRAHRGLGLPGAVVAAQAVDPALALGPGAMEEALAEGLARAAREGVAGPAVTPFLLGHVHRATGGRSLAANRELIVANARLAAEVAALLAPGAGGPISPPAPGPDRAGPS